MHIEKLQIELRPRSTAQALDLGFALLRTCPYPAYMTFAVLLLPVMALTALLTVLLPQHLMVWSIIPWWLRPLIERGTLYVLSRQVFGTQVSWQEAVRAWPRQLGGGWFGLLTWYRPFSAGRSMIQPVWQLENARGAVARERRRTLGAGGTAYSAFWFGVVCAGFEAVLLLGGLFFFQSLIDTGPEPASIRDFFSAVDDDSNTARNVGQLAVQMAVLVLVGPVYTACGFALYLNRRAALEAWDIEIKLRQIVRPAVPAAGKPARTVALIVMMVLGLGLAPAPDATAASLTREQCLKPRPFDRLPASGAEQERIRKQVDALYTRAALSDTQCVERWQYKQDHKDDNLPKPKLPDLSGLATLLKVIFIAGAIGAATWLLYRYRGSFPAMRRTAAIAATEVGGLDIRAASLPPNVTTEVRQLWHAGAARQALALLYRATLSRMVSDDRLLLRQGDTEGDCLRAANVANQAGRLTQGRLQVATATTAIWLGAAYGNRWPSDEQLERCCQDWDAQFPALERSAA